MAKRILDAVRAGHSYAAAARAGLVAESTLFLWLSKGRDGDPEYSKFSERFDAADQEAEERAVKVITSKMASADEKIALAAAQWWLTRRRTAQWGDKPGAFSPGIEGNGEQATDDLEVARAVVSALESRKAG